VPDVPIVPFQVRQQVDVTTRPYGKDVTRTIRYLLYLPEAYRHGAGDDWPLLLFLHGAGQRGDDLDAIKKHGPPKLVQARADFPLVVVSPQCTLGRRWDAQQLAELVEHVARTHRVDRSRMYITGLSMGGYGTWAMIAAHPKLFAAAVPICGGGVPENAPQIGGQPIWAFHGEQDPIVPLSEGQRMVDAIQRAGGNVRWTVYPGVAHDSWTATYENAEVWRWLLAQRRDVV
jgi:predicted peptidase